MAAIDALLRALQRHQMDSLLLVPGRRPRLRQADREHPVTKTKLDAETLAQLLAEIAPAGTDPRPGGEFGFDYALEGATFRFTGGGDGASWSARAAAVPRAQAGDREAATAPPATAAAATGRPIAAVPDLLRLLVERGASDLHLTVGSPPRIRLDGELEELAEYEAPAAELLERLLHEITPEHQREAFAATNDADFAYELPGQARFRVNLFRNRTGVAAVFRQIPHAILTFEQLGLPEQLRRLTELAKGLVLVTGPTGSGKSTTLAAMIDLINKTRRDHIITIEDPIEFVHPNQKLPGQPARGRRPHRLVQAGPAGGAARGPGHRPGRRDARPRDHRHRHRDRRDRPPGLRHPAHHHRRLDRRPDHRPVPRPTGRSRSASCSPTRCAR